ncbi:MAG: HAMP domain-containing protein, partial [Rudaea sp.]
MRHRLIPRSLQGRLLLTFLALNLVSVSGLIAWTAQRVESDTVEQTEHEMEIQAHILNDALREPVQNQLQGVTTGRSIADLVQSYAQSIGNRVTVFDATMKVSASSDRRVPAGYDEASRPELIAASKNDEQHDIRTDEWGLAPWLYVAVPISGAQNEPIGYVQLARPMGPVYADIRATWMGLAGAAGLLLLLTALASTILARQIAFPVQSLTATTEAIARGHLEERVTPGGPDEIRRLGDAFNQMAARVQDTLARQKEFVANAAHELRSPLTAIRLRLELVQNQSADYPGMTRRYLSEMDRELQSLQQLI